MDAHYIFHPSTIWVRPLCTELGPKPPSPPKCRFCHEANEYMSPSGDIKNRQTRPRSSAGSRPPLPKFSGYVEVEAHYIFHPSTIWVRPLYTELGRKNPFFAIKQTNRLSGDIKKDKLGPVAPRGVDPRSPNFQGM